MKAYQCMFFYEDLKIHGDVYMDSLGDKCVRNMKLEIFINDRWVPVSATPESYGYFSEIIIENYEQSMAEKPKVEAV